MRYLDLRGRLSRAVAVELLSHLTLWKSSDKRWNHSKSQRENAAHKVRRLMNLSDNQNSEQSVHVATMEDLQPQLRRRYPEREKKPKESPDMVL
jgi:hypothetical protein